MSDVKENEVRENRIQDEIIVDAYGSEEQAMGWYYYLEENLQFPFEATCKEERKISPLKSGEKVQVIDMIPEDDCMFDMFVEIQWSDRSFGVPLTQLEPVDVDDETLQAIKDWQYWKARGYVFY